MRDTTNFHQSEHGNLIALKVDDDLSVKVIQNSDYGYLMTTSDVAKGYGVSGGTIRMHIMNHKDEFKEGIHFMKGVNFIDDLPGAQPHQIYWSKAGIVRHVRFGV